MKLTFTTSSAHRRQRAWALLAVMSLSAAGLMVLAGVMNWADQNSANTARNNEYFTTAYAAEAATEKVLATMCQQFQNGGAPAVYNNIATYSSTVPTVNDDPYWTNYQFSAGTTPNQIVVTGTSQSNSIVMSAPYTGLTMAAYTYKIVATAVNTSSMFQIPATIGQQINLSYLPLFQFAIFYQNDLEITPNVAMSVTGTVHCNSNIYIAPSAGITFSNDVSASGQITQGATGPGNLITFDGVDLSGVAPLNLPIGTNTTGSVSNVSQNTIGILQIPQAGQTPGSSNGQNLLYNQADMIVLINSNGTVSVTSGAGVDGQATQITNWHSFLTTNASYFTDQRDSLPVNQVVIDVSNLVAWSATNTVLAPVLLSHNGTSDVKSIYFADLRSTNSEVVTLTGTNYVTNFVTNMTIVTNSVTNNSPTTTPYPPLPPTGTYVLTGPLGITFTMSHGLPVSQTYYAISKTITTNIISITPVVTMNVYNYTSTMPVPASQPGLVLSNGATLPPQGLSIATPDPAYIVGNWNTQKTTNAGAPSDVNTSATGDSLPSAIYADAITILSPAWNPNNSALAISSRVATSDTVNAAFLTGNVEGGPDGSGGVENLPRFLENWNNQTFTYNGSMVCMFQSQIATAPYAPAGSVYLPPIRTWGYDTNYNDPNKQPPLTPKVISVQRSQWVTLAPYSTNLF